MQLPFFREHGGLRHEMNHPTHSITTVRIGGWPEGYLNTL